MFWLLGCILAPSRPKMTSSWPRDGLKSPQEPKSSVFLKFLMVFVDARSCEPTPT